MARKIIGITGLIGSGKDTIANALVTKFGFHQESFAKSLKDACASIFVWDRTMLEGRTKEAREQREEKDEWWSERLGREVSPRSVLQEVGTEVFRSSFHPDIWIASMERRLMSGHDNIVVSDCRFPNEIAMIRRYGEVWSVKRGPDPEWWQVAIDQARYINQNPGVHHSLKLTDYPKVHYSEWG